MPTEAERARLHQQQEKARAAAERERDRALAGDPAAAREVKEAWCPLRPDR